MTIKNIYSNAKHQKEKEDYERNHGKTSDSAFAAGIRNYMPLDKDHRPLPIGTDITTEHGTITLYDGKYRVVDSEYFNNEVKKHRDREEYVKDMVDSFLTAGDALTKSTIGYYYNWLAAGAPAGNDYNQLVKYIMNDGFTQAQAARIATNIVPHDGTPNSIKSYTSSSQQFTDSLNKLLTICKYTGIIFTNKNPVPTPNITQTSNEGLTNPNIYATAAGKAEVARSRNLGPTEAALVLS